MPKTIFTWFILLSAITFFGCQKTSIEADYLITDGTIIDGTGNPSYTGDIALKDDRIIFVGEADTANIKADVKIDASGLIISPGFIDPHTHSHGDLRGSENNSNLNYLTQGVTTVITGNDGDGPFDIAGAFSELSANGIGTNVAFMVGHGTVRKEVLGGADVTPDTSELERMKELVAKAMESGALGLSTGLYYAPGSYSRTEEVIELATTVAEYNGIYDSHIRDESTYNVGLIEAVKEALEIGRQANISVNISHIKALGVDVWGKSSEVIELIEEAQNDGIEVTADQYPWSASGTHLENAVVSRWVMAGGDKEYYQRLDDQKLLPRIKSEIKENIRKRGGASSLLITADSRDTTMIGYNLEEISVRLGKDPVETALIICRNGGARVASFNMNEEDITNFMQQPWVMTSSDGTKGHPRKYASFPTKYHKYVKEKGVLSIESFIRSSSSLVASTFGIGERGLLKTGHFADIILLDSSEFKPMADFSNPELLSEGVEYLFVNGVLTIDQREFQGNLSGQVLRRD
ncbi:MAG: amidohydrolase family protein [Cyclobacteriaceae bacterium]